MGSGPHVIMQYMSSIVTNVILCALLVAYTLIALVQLLLSFRFFCINEISHNSYQEVLANHFFIVRRQSAT